MDEKLSRRDVMQQSAAFGALMVLGASGCHKAAALTCTDTSALAPGDIMIRTQLAYVDMSTEAGKVCSGCQQFQPAAPGACGTCKVVKGPINPNGNCKSFVAKT